MAIDDPEKRAALDALIREEWPRLRRFFRTKVSDTDAYDLVQATMLAFVEHEKHGEGARAYLWGIARKKVLQHFERQKPTAAFDSTVHTVDDAGRSLSSRIGDRDRLVAALRSLPADHQMAYELRHGEELSLEEVAAAIDVSLATVKRYLSVAQATLEATLGARADEVPGAYREG
jgi:RNA polymerase sigma-70 factor (ECF subfamily)